jgi:hypothetical protein
LHQKLRHHVLGRRRAPARRSAKCPLIESYSVADVAGNMQHRRKTVTHVAIERTPFAWAPERAPIRTQSERGGNFTRSASPVWNGKKDTDVPAYITIPRGKHARPSLPLTSYDGTFRE